MEKFISPEILLIELLLIGIFVALAMRHLNFPSTVALVLVGLAMALPQSIEVDFRSDVLLALAIPPLVFEAARRINLGELRQNLTRVLILTLPGVILTTLIVGGALNFFIQLDLPMALVFGAVISTTDPFATGALLRNLGVSKKLAVLIDGEILFNTAIAIVVFNLAITSMLAGQFQLLNYLAEFIQISGGGVAVGLVLGWSISRLVEWGNDTLIESALTTLLAFGSYLVAERLHFSGVLAVVAAGLINAYLRPLGARNSLWEYLSFLANSLVFLLMGLQVNLLALLDAWRAVLIVIVVVIVARAIVVYGLNGLMQHITDRVPMSWLHVWNWGGLRGAIAMALMLSLPERFSEHRELMKWMVFGVVLFSLLIQNTTMRGLLGWLGLVTDHPEQLENKSDMIA